MERKLATIQRICNLVNHADADRLEVATILGWQCVVEKGKFKENDLVVWFEIDSFIPTELAPFLTKPGHFPKEYEGIKGERLKSIRLRGQLSQGLVLPLSILPESFAKTEGADVTEILGIKKWEPAISAQLSGQAKGNFPSFIKKTDQERVQNLPSWFDKYRDLLWEVTIKLDGSSMTVFHNNGETGVCSRNLNLCETADNTFWAVQNRHGIINALVQTGHNVAIQGELIGEGIQGNHEKIKGQELYVFDIWDIEKQRHCTRTERRAILEDLASFGCVLQEVPVVHEAFQAFTQWPTMAEMLLAAEGPSLHANIREGLVFKATEPTQGEILSFKAISNSFLLQKKEK